MLLEPFVQKKFFLNQKNRRKLRVIFYYRPEFIKVRGYPKKTRTPYIFAFHKINIQKEFAKTMLMM